MHLKLQPFASKLGSRVFSDTRLPLTESLKGQKLGEEVRVNPSLTVADSRAQVLAEYGNGNASIAVRKHPRWQSVFIGEPVLTQGLLRGLYRQAGVPIYAADDDVAWVGDGLLCLHSAPGGGTTVYLPEDAVLHDFVYGETLASNGRGARLPMPVNGTRMLYFGPSAEAERFGAEPATAPPGLTESELPQPVAPFVFETPSPVGIESISAEDEALFQAALAELPAVNGEEEDIAPTTVLTELALAPEAATDEEAANERGSSRRRRGRGGRDRRRREDEPADTETEAVVVSEEAEPARRPSLEELLPLSEAPIDGELPPIPEEFLPLDEAAAEQPEAASGTRRGGRRRRFRGARGSEGASETPGAETD